MPKDIIRIALDLEFWADGTVCDTTKIIQLGYCIFNATTKEILHTGGDYVTIDKPLTEFIIKLTGITQHDHDTKGIHISEAISNMIAACKEYGVTFRQLVTWGNGDCEALREAWLELPRHTDDKWYFGNAVCNVKSVYQAKRIAEGKNFHGGLSTAMKKCDLIFTPYVELHETQVNGYTHIHTDVYEAHDARCDSFNTALIYLHLFP